MAPTPIDLLQTDTSKIEVSRAQHVLSHLRISSLLQKASLCLVFTVRPGQLATTEEDTNNLQDTLLLSEPLPHPLGCDGRRVEDQHVDAHGLDLSCQAGSKHRDETLGCTVLCAEGAGHASCGAGGEDHTALQL